MTKIAKIKAREILDSRGSHTVETDIWLSDGSFGRAAVPSGVSTGSHEALELRDANENRYAGKGVLRAVEKVNQAISPELVGKSFEQAALDKIMIDLDGQTNKSNLGANSILSVSMAFAHAAAMSRKQPLWRYFAELANLKQEPRLPVPLMNVINGGVHAQHSTDIQEFMIMPVGARTFREALRWGTEIFHALKDLLSERSMSTNVGDEGGYAPSFASNQIAIEAIVEAIGRAGYVPGRDIGVAIDAAANSFYEGGRYKLRSEFKELTAQEMIIMYQDWTEKYPLISIEDGLMEDDWEGYKHL